MLTCKPRDYGHMIKITQQNENEKKYEDQFSINQILKDEIKINNF